MAKDKQEPRLDRRFDAQTVGRLATVNDKGRFEIQFIDAEGRTIEVSLPVGKAVELGCMICDASERAPYLMGGVQTDRERRNSR